MHSCVEVSFVMLIQTSCYPALDLKFQVSQEVGADLQCVSKPRTRWRRGRSSEWNFWRKNLNKIYIWIFWKFDKNSRRFGNSVLAFFTTWNHMTLCKVMWGDHSQSVTKNLTPYRFNFFGWGLDGQITEIHSFPTMYIIGGGKWGQNGSKQWFSPKKW